jgi:N-acetylneuraminate synthase/sialic acid synthase
MSNPYIIAEVGQNHQGSLEEALRYVVTFASLGASAIKFQMRDNKTLFDSSIYDMPYESPNSFGETYGAHREHLELDYAEMELLRQRCKDLGVDFIVTPFDSPSLERCVNLKVDALKVASFDLGNLSFLDVLAQTKIPLIMSTGGGSLDHIVTSVNTITHHHNALTLLHCVSLYPCPLDAVNLGNISTLKQRFPDLEIGLSDHFNGTLTGPLAYTLGARVFEKHVTFDRSNKGTDHPFSLEPEGFRKFVRDISRVDVLMQAKSHKELGKEFVFQKLGKSIISKHDLPSGHLLSLRDLDGRICRPTMIPVRETVNIVGKRLKTSLAAGSYLSFDHLQDA